MAHSDLRRVALSASGASPLWTLRLAAPYAAKGSPLQQNFPVRVLATGGTQVLRAISPEGAFADGQTRETTFEVPLALWLRAGRADAPEQERDRAALKLEFDGCGTAFGSESFSVEGQPVVLARPRASAEGWPAPASEPGDQGHREPVVRLPTLEAIECEVVLKVKPHSPLAAALGACGGQTSSQPTLIRLRPGSMVVEGIRLTLPDGDPAIVDPTVSVEIRTAPDSRQGKDPSLPATIVANDLAAGAAVPPVARALWQRLLGAIEGSASGNAQDVAKRPGGVTVAAADRQRPPAFGWRVTWRAGILARINGNSASYRIAGDALLIRLLGNSSDARIVVPECEVLFSAGGLALSSPADSKELKGGTTELEFKWSGESRVSVFTLAALARDGSHSLLPLRYDPYRLTARVRTWLGRLPPVGGKGKVVSRIAAGEPSLGPASPPAEGAGSVADPLYAFQPLDSGWLQWALPDLDLVPPANDALDLPQQADPPSLIRGQWRMALVATGAEAIPRSLFVEHAGRASLKFEFARVAGFWQWAACSAKLQEVRGECTGLCWFGTGRPDELDALPTTAGGAMAFESLALAFGGGNTDPDVAGSPRMRASQLSVTEGPLADGEAGWVFGPFELHVMVPQPPHGQQPRAWLRHPRLPLVSEMPMTRSAEEASDPLLSRDLAPFDLKSDAPRPTSDTDREELPDLHLSMAWPDPAESPRATAAIDSPWPSLGKAGLVLEPSTDWPWPKAAPPDDTDAQGPSGRAIGFASIGAPGVVVAPLRGWAQWLDAYRTDIPPLDELFASAAPPATPEEGNGVGAPENLGVAKPAAATAARPDRLRAFWYEQAGRQALTRVQHSYAVGYAEHGASALRFECNVVVPRRRAVAFETLLGAGTQISLGGVLIGDWGPVTSNQALAGFSGMLKLGDEPSAPSVPVLGWAAAGWTSQIDGTTWTWDLRGLGTTDWLALGDTASRRAMRLQYTGLLQRPDDAQAAIALRPGARHARGSTVEPVSLALPGGKAWLLSLTGLPLEERQGTWMWDGDLAAKVAGEGWLGVDVEALEREHVGHADWVFELAPAMEDQGADPKPRAPDDDLLALGGLWFEPLRIVQARASTAAGGLVACDIIGRVFLSPSDRTDRMPAPLCQLSFNGTTADAALALAGLAAVTILREPKKAAQVVVEPNQRLSWPLLADLYIGSASSEAVPMLLSALPASQVQQLGSDWPRLLALQVSLLLCGRERTLDLGTHDWPRTDAWAFDTTLPVAAAGDEDGASNDGRLRGSLSFTAASLAQTPGHPSTTLPPRRTLQLGAEIELRTSASDAPCLRWATGIYSLPPPPETMTWLGTAIELSKLAFDHSRGTVLFKVQCDSAFEVCHGLAIDQAGISGGGVFVVGNARGPAASGADAEPLPGMPLPFRAGHVELLACRREPPPEPSQAMEEAEGLALHRVLLQGVIDAHSQARPPHALRLWGRCAGRSAIAWPSVNVVTDGAAGSTLLGNRLIRTRVGQVPLAHRIEFDLRGVRMPLGALAERGKDAGEGLWLRQPWEIAVAVRHALLWTSTEEEAPPRPAGLTLVGMQTVTVCSTATWLEPEPPAAQRTTFLARYRHERNRGPHGTHPNPDVLHPGIAARAVALQGSDGRAFRQAVAAIGRTSEEAPLAVTGKLLAWIAPANGGPAHWLELPFLRAFDGAAAEAEGGAGPLGRDGALTQSGADGMKLADADAIVASPSERGLAAHAVPVLLLGSLDQVAVERFVAAQLEGAGASAKATGAMETARAVEQFFAEPNPAATLETGAYWLRSLITVSAVRDAFPPLNAEVPPPAADAGGQPALELRSMEAVAVLPIGGRATTRNATGATTSSIVAAATVKVRVVGAPARIAASIPSRQDSILLSCGDRPGESPLETLIDSSDSSQAVDALAGTIRSMLPRLHRRAAYAVRLRRTIGEEGAPSELDFTGVPPGDDTFGEFTLTSAEYRPQALALSASPARGWPDPARTRQVPWRRGPRLGASAPIRAPRSGLAGWTDPVALPHYVSALQTLETKDASALEAELVWMVQRRQPAWLSGDLGGLIADTPGWLQPGRLRRRLPAPGAIRPPPKVSDADGDQSRELQAFLPPLLESTTVGARAGVVTVERYELLQALQARPARGSAAEQGGLLPFDERYPRFGQPAGTSAQAVRHVRSPRPGPLPENSGKRSSDRRLQASAARYDQACRVLAGPSEVLRGVWQLGDETPLIRTGPGQLTPPPSREWTAWLCLVAPAGARVSRPWRGGVALALEIELVEDSVDGRPLQEPTVSPLAHLTDQVLGRDASAWIQVAGARIPTLTMSPLLSSPAWSAVGTPRSRRVWKAAATLWLRFDPAHVFKALDALAASDLKAPGAVRLALNIGSPAGDEVTRPPQQIEFPLQVDADALQPRPAFESVSVLFNDPAYEAELRGAPARAVGTVRIEPIAASQNEVWEAVLYCDRTRIDHRTGFALMLDVRLRPSATTPSPRYAKQLAATAKLSVLAIARNGASRALKWLSADGTPQPNRAIHVGVPLASDLSALMESDGSPAVLMPGDQLQFVPVDSAGVDLGTPAEAQFKDTSATLRVPIAQRPVIPPPASFLAVLRLAGAGAGTRVAASATSPLPHRVGCFNLRDDMRQGSVRRSVDFRWIVAEPAAALATLRWQAIKFERTGQSWLPEAEAELATCERLVPEGFRPVLDSKVVAQLRAPSQQDRASWDAARKAASSNDAAPVMAAWRSAVGQWLDAVGERLQGDPLTSEAAVELLTGDRAASWAAGSIGLSFISRTRDDHEPPTPRWHRLYAGLAPDGTWGGAQLVSLGVLSPALGAGCIVIATLCAPAPASGSTATVGAFARLQHCLGDLCDALGQVAARRSDAVGQDEDGAARTPPTLGQRLVDARAAFGVTPEPPGRVPAMLTSIAATRAWAFEVTAALLDTSERSNTPNNGAN